MLFKYKDSGGNVLGTTAGICWAQHNTVVREQQILGEDWDGSMTVYTGPISISKRRANLFIDKVVERIIPGARDHYNISVESSVSFDTNIKEDPTIEVYVLSSMLRALAEFASHVNAVLFMMQRGIGGVQSYILGGHFGLVEKGPRLRDGCLYYSGTGSHYFIPMVGREGTRDFRAGDFARAVKLMLSVFITNNVEKRTYDTGLLPLSRFSSLIKREEDNRSRELQGVGSRLGSVVPYGSGRRPIAKIPDIKKYVQEMEELL